MSDLTQQLKEVEELVREKHQQGRHSQSSHTPKKYGKGGVAGKPGHETRALTAAGTPTAVRSEFEGMGFTDFEVTHMPDGPSGTIMGKVRDGEQATRRRLRKNGYESVKMNGRSLRGVYGKGNVQVSVQPQNFGRYDTRLSIYIKS